jgi:hypothetical protein
MAKKKVMTALEKFEIIKKNLCEYRGEKYDNNSKKDLEDRAILALLELKECEEEYIKSENEDFWFCMSFEDINLEEIGDQCFWDININKDQNYYKNGLKLLQKQANRRRRGGR